MRSYETHVCAVVFSFINCWHISISGGWRNAFLVIKQPDPFSLIWRLWRQSTASFWAPLPLTCLDGHPKVKQYIERFLALPPVKAYYEAKPARQAAMQR